MLPRRTPAQGSGPWHTYYVQVKPRDTSVGYRSPVLVRRHGAGRAFPPHGTPVGPLLAIESHREPIASGTAVGQDRAMSRGVARASAEVLRLSSLGAPPL